MSLDGLMTDVNWNLYKSQDFKWQGWGIFESHTADSNYSLPRGFQVTDENESFNFSLPKSPSVHISKREHQNIKTILKD